MKGSRRWRLRSLFTSWIVYWILLVIVKLGPPIAAIWRATRSGGPKGTASVNLSFSKFKFLLDVTSPTVHWSGSAHLLEIAAWIAVPPLLLWLVWMTQQSRPVITEDELRDQV